MRQLHFRASAARRSDTEHKASSTKAAPRSLPSVPAGAGSSGLPPETISPLRNDVATVACPWGEGSRLAVDTLRATMDDPCLVYELVSCFTGTDGQLYKGIIWLCPWRVRCHWWRAPVPLASAAVSHAATTGWLEASSHLRAFAGLADGCAVKSLPQAVSLHVARVLMLVWQAGACHMSASCPSPLPSSAGCLDIPVLLPCNAQNGYCGTAPQSLAPPPWHVFCVPGVQASLTSRLRERPLSAQPIFGPVF